MIGEDVLEGNAGQIHPSRVGGKLEAENILLFGSRFHGPNLRFSGAIAGKGNTSMHGFAQQASLMVSIRLFKPKIKRHPGQYKYSSHSGCARADDDGIDEQGGAKKDH